MKFSLSRFQQFALGLLLALVVVFSFSRSKLQGDVDEYLLMTIAIANHLSPDIRLDDIHRAQALLPEHAGLFQATADGMVEHKQVPKPGFYRANNDAVYAIHFFSYSALAALPFYVGLYRPKKNYPET